MAEDRDDAQKTEEPTPRKLEEARKKGDLPKSQEVSGFVVLFAGAVILAAAGGATASGVSGELTKFLAEPHAIRAGSFSNTDFWGGLGVKMLGVMALPFGVLMVAAVAAHVVQTGLVFSGERMKPKLSKVSPVEGLKRLFGPQAAANFLKGVGKLALTGAAAAIALWPRRDQLAALPALPPEAVLPIAREAAVALLVAALSVYAVIAGLDFLFQRQSYMKRQRMSRQEIKDEHRQSDGDPQVKARLRQVRQERARKRMLAAVPQATVVVTNPTHYAVALKYAAGETPAPMCVAKGVDAVALRIRETAEAHGVPVVENPPLARALFATAELDQLIPAAHYEAVAKVIGYVLSLARGRPPRAP